MPHRTIVHLWQPSKTHVKRWLQDFWKRTIRQLTCLCSIANNCFARFATPPAVTHCRCLSQHQHQDLGTNSALLFASVSQNHQGALNVVTYIVLCVFVCCLTVWLLGGQLRLVQKHRSSVFKVGFSLLCWIFLYHSQNRDERSLSWFALAKGSQHNTAACPAFFFFFFCHPSIFFFSSLPQRNLCCSLPTLFCISLCTLAEKCTAGLNAATTLQHTICHLEMHCSVHHAQSL